MINFLSKLGERLKNKLRYELGINCLENNYESLFFLFNSALDITQLPPTKNLDLRYLQKCDTLLLAIFDRLCAKHKLNYWLDSGTLLGAVRHRGFIPWDDDIDVCMLRRDFNKVIPLMKEDIESFGLSINLSPLHPMRGLVLSYKPNQTGIWLDIFPLDPYNADEDKSDVQTRVQKYRTFFYEHKDDNNEILISKKKEIFPNKTTAINHYLLATLESWKGCNWICIHEEKDIFPIQKMSFEGYSLCAPAKPDEYLQHWYGNKYMEFPKNAINNHGIKSSEQKLYERAKANGISMEEVYNYLADIYKKLSSEIEL